MDEYFTAVGNVQNISVLVKGNHVQRGQNNVQQSHISMLTFALLLDTYQNNTPTHLLQQPPLSSPPPPKKREIYSNTKHQNSSSRPFPTIADIRRFRKLRHENSYECTV